MKTKNKKSYLLYFFVFSIMLAWSIKGCAQNKVRIDTIVCHIECIDKFIEHSTNDARSTRIYAVYNDKQQEISELIPVGKSVYNYILMCKENNLTPHLGIRLRNGQISSIIRYKQKHIIKRFK